MWGRPIEPHSGNIADAALLEGAAAKLRKFSLDLTDEAKNGATIYAEDAFAEALSLIDDAVSALSGAATRATENAIEDAAGEAADRAYDERDQ
ncbi:hypothetical protein UFOVP233_25 [uncultured Caudovirales phage]|uniref:Uncharacterized protein n=1 Tax=uncultured Caudovirales phage TaxID=2100421 RepID=A0A6J7WQP8_9CAUD|nr:hypothetical protein UFOVP233_25 [uncultured Caudovirales phage]